MNPEAGFAHPDRMTLDGIRPFEDCFDDPYPKKTATHAKCLLLQAFGFENPCDNQTIEITSEVESNIRKALATLKRATGAKNQNVVDVIKQAITSLQSWGVYPKRPQKNRNLYKLERSNAAKAWGEITYQRIIEYKAFSDELYKREQETPEEGCSEEEKTPYSTIMGPNAQKTFQQDDIELQQKREKKRRLETTRRLENDRKQQARDAVEKRERESRKNDPAFHDIVYPKDRSEFFDFPSNSQPKEQRRIDDLFQMTPPN